MIVLALFYFEGVNFILLPIWLLFGVVLGVGIDFDHLFHALIFNWKVALEDILSFNPMKLYRDYMNGKILKGKINFDQKVIYLSFHLIWIIIVNLLISIYFPNFIMLSLIVTGVHYVLDIIALFLNE